MSRAAVLGLVALLGVGAGGYWIGRYGLPTRRDLDAIVAHARGAPAAAASGPILYYRDPDGGLNYSAAPAKTAAGRDFTPVRASEEASLAPAPASPTAANAAAPAEPSKRIKYYRNPMGLPDTSPAPKKDSMGMDYIPVFDGETDDGAVRMTPGRVQKTGARSELPTRTSLSAPISAPGAIALDERRISVVSLRFEGFIEEVENITTGAFVKKGQPLMRIYGPSLSSASAEYLSVVTTPGGAGLAGIGLRNSRRRLENLGMPDAAIAGIEKLREAPLSVEWPAPQAGLVLERAAVNGMRAAPGDVLFRIGDASVVWALIDLSERDLAMVAIGQRVTVRPRATPGRAFTGKVALVYPQINRETRTGRVRVELANPDGALKPDMYVDATVETGAEKPVLTVPESAVLDDGARRIVLVDRGEGRFEPRRVTLGRRGADRVEIADGLRDDERVVVSANFLIDAESNLKAALSAIDPPGAAK